jgi:hypothetical protein
VNVRVKDFTVEGTHGEDLAHPAARSSAISSVESPPATIPSYATRKLHTRARTVVSHVSSPALDLRGMKAAMASAAAGQILADARVHVGGERARRVPGTSETTYIGTPAASSIVVLPCR